MKIIYFVKNEKIIYYKKEHLTNIRKMLNVNK